MRMHTVSALFMLVICLCAATPQGSKIVLRGEAGCSEPGLQPGDVILMVQQKDHDYFKRVNVGDGGSPLCFQGLFQQLAVRAKHTRSGAMHLGQLSCFSRAQDMTRPVGPCAWLIIHQGRAPKPHYRQVL